MKSNVIILTSGISGSSVLAGLISRAGYWLGEKTEKVEYETFENSSLVRLNIELLRNTDYLWRDIADIPCPSIEKISALYENVELNTFNRFVIQCDKHTPWLWKDPRLSYTIFFWKRLIDVSRCKFILMSRNPIQTWTGIILRGKMGMPFNKLFFQESKVECLNVDFDDLILMPDNMIEKLNDFLGTELKLEDLKSIYNGPLYHKRWSKFDYAKATLKFLYYKYLLRSIIEFPRDV